MDEREVRKIVQEAVKETLVTLGIPADDPIEVQKDMQHLRAWRESVQTVKRQAVLTAIAVVITGALGLVWVTIKGNG